MKLATVNMEKVETHQRENEGDFVSRVKFQGDVQLASPIFIGESMDWIIPTVFFGCIGVAFIVSVWKK